MNAVLLILLLALSAASGQTLQERRWDAAKIEPRKERSITAIVERIMASKSRYTAVADKSNVPWYVLSGLHNMESSGSFRHHLHEGSPLSGRTRWIPKGRPFKGSPPFTWEESAADALDYDKMGLVNWSSLDATLYACERYNGLGYANYHPDIPTPYLWASTTIEKNGKYVADGKFSYTARSAQIGIAAIWKMMEHKGALNLGSLKRK